MKTSQTVEIWKKFLKEHRELEEEVLEEEEPFQKAVKKGYLKDRDEYLTSGPQKTDGAPFDKKPKRSRSKSAPPAGVPVAEDTSLEESLLDRIRNVLVGRKASATSPEESDAALKDVLRNKTVDIPIEQNGVYRGSWLKALKDPQVLKLVALYKQENPNVDLNDIEEMIKNSPTDAIQLMLVQSGTRNTAEPVGDPGENTTQPQEDPSKPNEVSIQNDVIPKLRTISKQDKGKTKALKNLVGYKIVNLPKKEVGKDHIIDILRVNKFSEEEVEELISVMDNKKIVKENLSINNVSGADLAELTQNINKFYPYAQEYLKFDRPASLNLVSDPNNAKDAFGKTAYYNPNNDEITIFVDKRHPKDMIRSFSHELVHHTQNCRGEFDKDFVAGENYIEENDHLNLMEREAYEKGNMCLRYYESYLKKENNKMSLNEETLRKAIREAIKRVTEDNTKQVAKELVAEAHCPSDKRDDYMEEEEATVTEDSGEEEAWHQWKNEHADDNHIEEIEHHLRALKGDRDHERDEAEYDHDKYEDEGMEETADKNTGMSGMDGDDDDDTYMGHMKEETIEEDEAYTAKKEKPGNDKRKGAEKRGGEGTLAKTKGHGKVDYVNEEETGTLKESFNQAKGKLIFNRLVDKWCK